jgi:hypothetical protein
MRALLLALLVAVAGCEAIDDFDFHFDGGADGGDAGAGLVPFGEACMPNQCQQYGPQRPVSCLTTINASGINVTFPGGMCSRACTPGVGACSDFGIGAADCVMIDNGAFCVPHCNAGPGTECRTGYNCCVNNKPTTGPGSCVPANKCN